MSFSDEFLDTQTNQNSPSTNNNNSNQKSDKKDIMTYVKYGFLVVGVLFVVLVKSGVFADKPQQEASNEKQPPKVEQPKPNQGTSQANPQQTQESKKVEVKTEPKQSDDLPNLAQAKNNTQSDNNQTTDLNATKKADLGQDWNRQIQTLFLKEPIIDLDKEKPIIDINNFDIFLRNKEIEIATHNAIIKPAELIVTNDDIIINIEIANKQDSNFYIQKFYPLKEYGFNPLYFDDSLYFRNQIYIAGDKILFFDIKSIKKLNDNQVEVVLEFNGKPLKMIKEIANG